MCKQRPFDPSSLLRQAKESFLIGEASFSKLVCHLLYSITLRNCKADHLCFDHIATIQFTNYFVVCHTRLHFIDTCLESAAFRLPFQIRFEQK
ncbi:hypothetical protein D3C77_458350 [compost metagenome]